MKTFRIKLTNWNICKQNSREDISEQYNYQNDTKSYYQNYLNSRLKFILQINMKTLSFNLFLKNNKHLNL